MTDSDSGKQYRHVVSQLVMDAGPAEYVDYLRKSMADAIAREITDEALAAITEVEMSHEEYYNPRKF